MGRQWTRQQWELKVIEMLQEEPDVTREERAAIVEYLAANFRPGGKIYMRGHMAKEKPADGDPKYLYWEGWLDATGKLTQQTGEQIDWSKDEWQKKFKPE